MFTRHEIESSMLYRWEGNERHIVPMSIFSNNKKSAHFEISLFSDLAWCYLKYQKLKSVHWKRLSSIIQIMRKASPTFISVNNSISFNVHHGTPSKIHGLHSVGYFLGFYWKCSLLCFVFIHSYIDNFQAVTLQNPRGWFGKSYQISMNPKISWNWRTEDFSWVGLYGYLRGCM